MENSLENAKFSGSADHDDEDLKKSVQDDAKKDFIVKPCFALENQLIAFIRSQQSP